MFIGPALVIYTLVVLVPIIWSAGYSLFDGSLLGGFHYAGLHNFQQLAADTAFWNAFFFTVKYALVVTIGQVSLGLLLALLYVFYLRRASGVIRTIVFFPVVLPTVAVAQLFKKLFEIAPQYGLVNSLLATGHLDGWIQAWLGQGGTAFWVIVVMDIWRSMGFYAVLLFAGLVDVPQELIEAARIDGANGWRLVRRIVLPLLTPIMVTSVIFSINGTLKVFDSVLALTNGGPGLTTTPLTLYMFDQAFDYGEYGYGSSVAMSLAFLSLLVTLLIFRFARSDPREGAVA